MWAERRSSEGEPTKPFNSNTGDSPAQRDRARVIHCAAFRRLQSKTQVLGIGESDFYRTRLTHSLEVAQIGSGICEALKEKYRDFPQIHDWIPSLSQIESICLAHDLGHPSFGHGGEVALNFFMHSFGGFEGNGQTLRIVSTLGEYSPAHGLDLTRRTMLGLLKYPVLHWEVANYPMVDESRTLNIDHCKPPKCIHDEDEPILNWVLKGIPDADQSKFREVHRKDGISYAQYKAFDTSIMELADDISYGVHDLEDALAMGMISFTAWENEILQALSSEDVISKDKDFYNQKLFSECNKARKHAISKLIGYFISQIRIVDTQQFETPLLSLQATMSDEAVVTLDLLKQFIFKHVIRTPEVQILEYKGQQMILKLFEVLRENPERLLPRAVFRDFQESPNPNRVICDYLSSMTDTNASKLYHKLFTPSAGSIFDRASLG